MSDPCDILGIDRAADEAEVRRRYLELVRQFPPDREPKRFAEIRAAYEQLRDPVRRIDSMLFSLDHADVLDAILSDALRRVRQARISTKALLSLAERP